MCILDHAHLCKAWQIVMGQYQLLPARRYASAGLCDSDVSICPSVLDPPAAEYPPNSPKKHRWPKIRRKKMRLAENPPNRKFAAAAEKNCGYCGAFNTTGC